MTFLILAVIAAGSALVSPFFSGAVIEVDSGYAVPEEKVSITIACVGDIMLHMPQINSQYDRNTGEYNFNENFQYVKPYLERADLAVCNVETTFSGGSNSGFPHFSSPDQLAESLKWAGFDVAVTANNHMMDTGYEGMIRTVDVLEAAGLVVSGTRREEGDAFSLVDVKGVKVAVIAYTYGSEPEKGAPSVNGNYIPEKAAPLVNIFDLSDVDRAAGKILSTAEEARQAGAQVVICYLHLGTEYQRLASEFQKQLAQRLAKGTVDIIIGTHPHVLQPMEWLPTQEASTEVPVFYSLGNFYSNQRLETMDSRYVEQGAIAWVSFDYLKETGQMMDVTAAVVPTWVEKYWTSGKNKFSVIPLDAGMESNPELHGSGHMDRAWEARADIVRIYGEEMVVWDELLH